MNINTKEIKKLIQKPHPLNEDEINMFIQYAAIPGFLGTFPKDSLPPKINENESCIINLDNSDGGGTHWVSVYCGKDYCEYFDSYGIIADKNIRKFMKTSKKTCIYSTNEIQPVGNDSILCGYYALYYIIKRARNVPAYDITYKFGIDNQKSNDKLLLKELMLGYKNDFEF